MSDNNIPVWLSELDYEDINFIKNFILASGSLKEISAIYDVTYPTIRLRLDRLIQKIKVNDSEAAEPYIALVKKLAIDEKITLDAAKILISEYKKQTGGGN